MRAFSNETAKTTTTTTTATTTTTTELTSKINGENVSDGPELLLQQLDQGRVPRGAGVPGGGDGRERKPHDTVGLEASDVVLLTMHQAHLHPLHGHAGDDHSVFDHTPLDRAAVVPFALFGRLSLIHI